MVSRIDVLLRGIHLTGEAPQSVFWVLLSGPMGVLGTDYIRAVSGPGVNLAAARINRIQGPRREPDAAVFVLLGFLLLCDFHNYIISHIKIGVKKKTLMLSICYMFYVVFLWVVKSRFICS
jgi:hypothetical protein